MNGCSGRWLERSECCPPELAALGLRALEIVSTLVSTRECMVQVVKVIGAVPPVIGVSKAHRKGRCAEATAAAVLEARLHAALAACPSAAGTVVPFWGALDDGLSLHLLTAHCESDLRCMLHNCTAPLSEATVRDALVRPLLRGLSALHAAGWVHRDVKPENVLISDRGTALLADLGLAAPCQPAPAPADTDADADAEASLGRTRAGEPRPSSGGSSDQVSTSCVSRASSCSALEVMNSQLQLRPQEGTGCTTLHASGTPAYAAPEVVLAAFSGMPAVDAVGPHNDIWSLGVLVFECLTGAHPFGERGMSPAAFVTALLGSNYSRSASSTRTASDSGGSCCTLPLQLPALHVVSPECHAWLAAALERNPVARASAAQLLRHEWLASAAVKDVDCDGAEGLLQPARAREYGAKRDMASGAAATGRTCGTSSRAACSSASHAKQSAALLPPLVSSLSCSALPKRAQLDAALANLGSFGSWED